jgi:hypothetical protein
LINNGFCTFVERGDQLISGYRGSHGIFLKGVRY